MNQPNLTHPAAKPAESQSPESQFIQRLEALRENKGAFARLKRNAGNIKSESRNVFPIFFGLLPRNAPKRHEESYFLIATLYPLANPTANGTLGTALKEAKVKKSKAVKVNEKNKYGFDRRMETLLDSDKDQLPFRLRQIIRLLKSAEVPVNWAGLLKDLKQWDHPDRFVQERWAKDYYTKPSK